MIADHNSTGQWVIINPERVEDAIEWPATETPAFLEVRMISGKTHQFAGEAADRVSEQLITGFYVQSEEGTWPSFESAATARKGDDAS